MVQLVSEHVDNLGLPKCQPYLAQIIQWIFRHLNLKGKNIKSNEYQASYSIDSKLSMNAALIVHFFHKVLKVLGLLW